MDTQLSVPQNARRKVINAAVCAICHENGFGLAERAVVDTLVEMMQSVLREIGRSSQAYCELAGRTQPVVGDVVIALIEMGIDVGSIPSYAKRSNRVVIPKPAQAPRQSLPKILQAGDKKPLSSYIPDYFPPFPDSHSYIRTPTYKQPVTEYEAIREKSASQKRDVERALTRFMAKTCENSHHSLFLDEQMGNLFPLIAPKLQANPYLAALLPKDQIFEEDEEEESKEPPKKVSRQVENKVAGEAKDDESSAGQKNNPESAAETEVPDNPYLRQTKIIKTKSKRQIPC